MFPTSKRFTKLLAICLTVLVLTGNLVVLVPASAEAVSASSTQTNELPVLTVEKTGAGETQVTQSAFSSDSIGLSNDQKAAQFLNQLIPYYLQTGKRQGPEWLRTTDISFSFTENYKPVFSLETLQPFSQATKNGTFLFWQGRYSYQGDADATANLGLGWRKLSTDKSSMLGFNAFYDYGFQHDLSRIGVGTEYFNKLAEYRTNFYFPVSGDRLISETSSNAGLLYTYIRAVQGFDYEAGSALANAPWLGFYASGFYYDNKHNDDEKGYKLRSTLQLSPRLSLEMGYTHSNLSSGDVYGKIQYQLADKLGPSLFGDRLKDKKSQDISYKLLQKVQRENQIKTETFTKFVSYIGSVSTTVTNGSGQPIQGVSLQAYQNGNPVGGTVITNAAGTGVISGLDVGAYTIKATYFGYSANSGTVTVQKDQVANAALSLPVVGGTIAVNVFDAQGGSVSGATVTANVVSDTIARTEGTLFDRILGVKTAFAAEAEFTLSLTTGSDGSVRFTNLPPGNYRFTVQSNGQSMNSIAANVPTNGGTDHVNVVLTTANTTTGSAAITVTDGSSPLSGATASVTVNGTTQTVTTNSSGLATFSDLPAGSYSFSVTKDGYVSNAVTVAVSSGVTAAGTIALALPAGNATITVDDGTGPLSGATVSMTVNGTAQTATTNASGQATFTNVPAGTYAFTVTKTGYSSNTGSVTITAGGSTAGSISLTGLGSVSIAVSSAAAALPGATVSVTVNGSVRTLTTNNTGVTTFTDLQAGSYTFTASKAGYDTSTGTATVTTGLTTTAISLTRQVGTVTITVMNGTSTVSNATVTLKGTQSGITDELGQVVFQSLPSGVTSYTVTATGYDTKSGNLTIASGTSSETISIVRQTGTATITVNDGTAHTPVSGAAVTISGLADWTVTTDALGQATFANVPTDTYIFTATKSGYSTSTTIAQVQQGTTTNGTITIVRQSGAALITVRDGATPVPNATVSVTVDGAVRTQSTDTAGQTQFNALPIGDYTFTITKADYNTNTCSATVTNTNVTPADVSLVRQTGSATITVNDGENQPLSGALVSMTTNGRTWSKVTDASGQATLTNIPTGTYTFTASKTGYDNNTTTVTITNGATATGSISLPEQAFGTVVIHVRGLINPLPIAGYIVYADVNGTTRSATTDANGDATFSNLPVGTYLFYGTDLSNASIPVPKNQIRTVNFINYAF